MIADALYYIFLPALVNMLAFIGLRRAADSLSFPFSGTELRNMRLEAVEELLDDKIFMIFGSLNLVFVSLTMVQIFYGWENSTRYIWLNLLLCVWYLVVLIGFYKRVWDRTWGARLFCSGHLLFMWIGSAVSGGPVIKVLFEQYAFAAIFSLFALISSVEFSFILFMATSFFVLACEQGLIVTSTDPWFALHRMEASATYLPVVVAAAVLVHVGARRLIGVYKNRRLVLEYAQAAKQKDEFLRNVTHEIKHPLTGIMGCAELLRANAHKFSEDDAKSVNVILHSSSVLGLLVNNVLSRDVVRSEESVVWEDTDLRSFVAGILDLLKNLVFKSDIRFDVAVSEAVPEMVVLPRSMLTQILLNLGLNAIKHAGSGKEVLLRVEANFDNNLECQVCDRGPGLGDEEEIFGKNRKVSATSGTGLGLEVCKSLCELIRGKLKYRRNGKKGSVFYVEFSPRPRDAQALRRLTPPPLAAVMAAPPADEESLCEADDQEKLHMLIVDDSSVNVMVLTNLLTKRLGVEEALCSSASDGFAGLQYCMGWCRDGGGKPLVVFMDREMPGMNGEACTRHWRQMEQTFGVKQPAYIVAVSAGQDSMRDCNERLDKPIQLVQLSNILASVLRNLRHPSIQVL